MTRKKRAKKTQDYSPEKYLNLPTPERLRRGGISISDNRARADAPLRIDKLLKNGIIDEMQHLYGLQVITLWTLANRPFMKTSRFEQRTGGKLPDFDLLNISRMSADEQLYKAMAFMRKRERSLICKICFDEMGAIEAGRALKLPVNSITVYVRAAFDALGDALAHMRDLKKAMETPPKEEPVEGA